MATKLIKHADKIFSLKGFWDKELCEAIIAHTEETNLFPEKETQKNQKTLEDNLSSRNDFRVFLDSEELASSIYEYLSSHLKCISVNGYHHSSIHPHLRVYKYLPGQEFKKHRDGSKIISDSEKSHYSLLIYLNKGFKGGKTVFDTCEVIPTLGQATFFPHEFEHSGTIVTKGVKYVLRGNIMFKKNK